MTVLPPQQLKIKEADTQASTFRSLEENCTFHQGKRDKKNETFVVCGKEMREGLC